VIDAARTAQAHDFISGFPEGYESVLGRGGVNLSGGQRQRISIARALIRKPDILIFDDSMSAIDTGTETRLREALRQAVNGTTCFIISQRLSSVMDSDAILLLENGRMEGFDSHHNLLKSSPLYNEIYHSQIGREVPEDG
jgi:ATP-binding cassette subfamily B protein